MKKIKIMVLVGMLLFGSSVMFAEENNVTNEIDTTYIKLDANLEPINFVNSTFEDLQAAVGELEMLQVTTPIKWWMVL